MFSVAMGLPSYLSRAVMYSQKLIKLFTYMTSGNRWLTGSRLHVHLLPDPSFKGTEQFVTKSRSRVGIPIAEYLGSLFPWVLYPAAVDAPRN